MGSSARGLMQSIPEGIAASEAFFVQARNIGQRQSEEWISIPAISVDVADVNLTCNEFNKHPVSLVSLDKDRGGPVEIRAIYSGGPINLATVRPSSLGIQVAIEGDAVTFTLDRSIDVMLEINNDKWEALHILVNEVDTDAPTGDSENVWYFGPGVNNGLAFNRVIDGNLMVPSNTTVYLDSGAFVTARLNFIDVENSSVRGHGFIYQGSNGAILIERSSHIFVGKVTSLGATGVRTFCLLYEVL